MCAEGIAIGRTLENRFYTVFASFGANFTQVAPANGARTGIQINTWLDTAVPADACMIVGVMRNNDITPLVVLTQQERGKYLKVADYGPALLEDLWAFPISGTGNFVYIMDFMARAKIEPFPMV